MKVKTMLAILFVVFLATFCFSLTYGLMTSNVDVAIGGTVISTIVLALIVASSEDLERRR